MKRYCNYMDEIKASPALRERLAGLGAPKRANPGRGYAAAAAAVCLAVGLGLYGALRPVPGRQGTAEVDRIEPGIAAAPGVAEFVPGRYTETAGGYEVIHGETASYYRLPKLTYGSAIDAADSIAAPDGVERRDLTEEEIAAVFGGGDVLEQHLAWGEYEVGGFAMEYPDGTLWLLCVYGSRGESGLEHFELTVSPGALPPACIACPEEKINRVWGADVAAAGSDSDLASHRRVSFVANGYGCRFDIVGRSADEVENLTARFVRLGVREGLFSQRETTPDGGDSAGQPGAASTPAREPEG